MKDSISEICSGKLKVDLRKEEFWALDDISFELKRGECLGLLGKNGSGKTTLLKILSGLIKPDKGSVTLHGQVGGLIALGAGFNGLLSGRENVRVNGAILGYSRKEIEEKMQEIIDFSEINEFIDAPVNTYSSGMNIRLGFAIAIILNKPDILLLDEVLAVGDIGFTTKSLNAVKKMMEHSSVIFVSHNMQMVSHFCSKVIIIDRGILLEECDTSMGVEKYVNSFAFESAQIDSDDFSLKNFKLINCMEKEFEIQNNKFQINQFEDLIIRFEIDSKKEIKGTFTIDVMDCMKSSIVSFILSPNITLSAGTHIAKINLDEIWLNGGNYSFVIGFKEYVSGKTILQLENKCAFSILAEKTGSSNLTQRAGLEILASS